MVLGSRCCWCLTPPGAVPSSRAAPAPMSSICIPEKWKIAWIYFERSTRFYWGSQIGEVSQGRAGRTHFAVSPCEPDGLDCAQPWEISEGRIHILLDLEITGFFFSCSPAPGCLWGQGKRKVMDQKSCCHNATHHVNWRVICLRSGSIYFVIFQSPMELEGLCTEKYRPHPSPKSPIIRQKVFDTKAKTVELLT